MNSLSAFSKRPVFITTQRILVWLSVSVSVLLLCLPASRNSTWDVFGETFRTKAAE